MDDSSIVHSHDLVADPGRGCGPLARPANAIGSSVKRQVYEAVRSIGSISRADLAKYLDVSPASITAATNELMAARLLIEKQGVRREGGRGRPPVDLELAGKAGHVMGIKLSDARHSAVIVDLAGNIVAESALSTPPRRRDTETLLEQLDKLVEQVLAAADMAHDDLVTIGIGLPGGVDHESGRVVWSPILNEGNIDLGGLIEHRFGRPTVIDNDTNLVVLAELWFGEGRSLSNFAVVTIEHGVGMGVVIDHRLFRGGQGLGMELGHIKVQIDGALCRCGQRGCLEAYLADYALVREASTALDWSPQSGDASLILLESLFDQAKAGNEAARTIFRRAGRYLAVGLSTVVTLFDPALIILSGERMKYDYLYAEDVMAEMRLLAFNGSMAPPVRINTWGDLVWARGAAALALDHATGILVDVPV